MNLAAFLEALKQAINLIIEIVQKVIELKNSVPIFAENKDILKEFAINGNGILKFLAIIVLSMMTITEIIKPNSIIRKILNKINHSIFLHNRKKLK